MNKKSHLNIWLHGQQVGTWYPGRNAQPRLKYAPGWLANPHAVPLSLSLSLPLTDNKAPYDHSGDVVTNYFENLLPDNQAIRDRIKERFRVRNTQAHNLLAEIGRDCVGAIQILPPDVQPEFPPVIRSAPLSDDDIERVLRDAVAPPLRGLNDDDEFRISIAGAQEKTALLWHDGRWCRPLGNTATTHIFKLPLGIIGGQQRDLSESVENEWLCAQILGAFGLDTPYCQIAQFGEQKTLIVERFDREWRGSELMRLPQEDCCQAMGLHPQMKYESDGGPGMVRIAQLLATSRGGLESVGRFLRAQVLFYLLAATDGHAKNFSIRLLHSNQYELLPFYDILSIWPLVGKSPRSVQYQNIKMAMGFKATKGTKRSLHMIMPRHMEATAKACGYPELRFEIEQIMDLLEERLALVQASLPDDFPPRLFESISGGMKAMRARFVAAQRNSEAVTP